VPPDRTLRGAYAAEMAGATVRARAIRGYLAGLSACEIAAALRRTTTPASITAHLHDAGLGGVHWCPVCRALEEV
jgi:hypothetical protein